MQIAFYKSQSIVFVLQTYVYTEEIQSSTELMRHFLIFFDDTAFVKFVLALSMSVNK